MIERATIPNFDLNLLGPLKVLLAERNVTVAASILGVGQSTMSGILARLRVQFQDPLLVRVGRNMELTPRAAKLSKELGQLLLSLEQLAAPQDEFDSSRDKYSFRIMASEASLMLILPQLFRKVVDEAPGVTFEVLPIENPVDSVYSGVVDLAITGDSLRQISGECASYVRTQTLYDETFVALVDADHPLRDSIEIEEFRNFPRVATQFPGISWTVEDLGISEVSALHPPKMRVPSFLAIGALIVGTRAIGIVPSRIAPMLLAQMPLRALAISKEFPIFPLKALWHSRHDHDAPHRWLRGQILEISLDLKRTMPEWRPDDAASFDGSCDVDRPKDLAVAWRL